MMRPRRRDEGVALLLALLFVILLSAIVVEYCYEMQVEATFVASESDELQAYVAAKSAIAAGRALLAEEVDPATRGPAGPGSSGNAVTLLDPWFTMGIPYQPINDAIMQARIRDEGGKLNLNALYDKENDQPQENIVKILQQLFKIRKVDQDPTDAIIDWLDPNQDVQGANGAELDTYQSLTIPYTCPDGPMHSIEELLLIRGITPEIYFGDPQIEVPDPALSDLLTVHGDDTGKVNINTAEPQLIEAIGEAMDENSGLGEVVRQKREMEPFEDAAAIKNVLEGSGFDKSVPLFVVTSNVFRVEGQGIVGDTEPVKVLIVAYVQKGTGAGTGAGTGTGTTPVAGAGSRLLEWRVIR
ncbi:MAG: type II secretion system minor pseudopilin GspK [Candidatus Hydrogenedentes bacterium]|nr:type II secretion system minor pseudopilin GspK [Candidatus Hydrogenedentota bacterium]